MSFLLPNNIAVYFCKTIFSLCYAFLSLNDTVFFSEYRFHINRNKLFAMPVSIVMIVCMK